MGGGTNPGHEGWHVPHLGGVLHSGAHLGSSVLHSGAHLAPQARVRVAAAPPTRSLFEYSVPPPGVSELGAHLFAEVSPKKPLPGTRPTLGVAGGRAN